MNIQFAIQEGSAETFTTVKEQVLILPLKTIIFALSLGQNKQGNMTEEKKRAIGRILIHILVMVVLAFIIILMTFRWMKSYTRHGQYITVPDVSGMYEEEAARTLAASGLIYEISDYKYDKEMVEGGVIEQKPKSGSYVKEGRKVYLTLNSGKEPLKSIPDLADNSSLRAAESHLRAAGFKLSPTLYIDGDQDWVYEIRYLGQKIEAGTEIPEGSLLTIVAGNGNPVEHIEEVDSATIVDSDFFE